MRRARSNIETVGIEKKYFTDLYHLLLRLPWPKFTLVIFSWFVACNFIFAGLYLAGGDCIGAKDPHSFLEAFAFSVQTMVTIGYGIFHPTTSYALILSCFEAFFGMFFTAAGAGLMFAKFSRPTARLRFTKNALVTLKNGVPTLQFRVANMRTSVINDVTATLTAMIDEVSSEGQELRRPRELTLERSRTPFLSLAWILIHPITADSPLYGITEENKNEKFAMLVVSIQGVESQLTSQVSDQHFYRPQDLILGARFVDMIEDLEDGRYLIDHRKLDQMIKN